MQPQEESPTREERGDDEARAVPDGKAVDAGQSASHVGCISNSQATRSDDESRSVVEGRAHHDDDEERPRRLAVAPSMLGYARGISCRIASSRRRTMSAAAGRVADPRKKSSATMRHERCQTAKPSTRGRVPATSAAFQTAKRLGAMTRVAASARVEPITTTMKSAHGA